MNALMEELRSEKNTLLNLFDKSDDAGMTEIGQRVDSMEASLQRLEKAETRYTSELDTALTKYAELTKKAADMEADEIHTILLHFICSGKRLRVRVKCSKTKSIYE